MLGTWCSYTGFGCIKNIQVFEDMFEQGRDDPNVRMVLRVHPFLQNNLLNID